MEVSGVEATGGENIRLEGSAKGEVATETDAERAELAGAIRAATEVVKHRASISVMGFDRLGVLQLVAAIGAGLVVGEHGAGGFVFVVHLGKCDDDAVAGEHGRGATDGCGDLEDLRVENNAGVLAWRGGANDVGAHGAGWGGEVDILGVDDGHDRMISPWQYRFGAKLRPKSGA